MENRGFEEERQSRAEGTKNFPRAPFSGYPSRVDGSSVPGSDGHVYEDVSPVAENASGASNDPSSRSPEHGGFRRNLTLPFRRGVGLDSVASSSVRVTSREKTEVSTGRGAPVDDAARAQSSDCRPNRRRRKRDCKHCRSKQAARDQPPDDWDDELQRFHVGGTKSTTVTTISETIDGSPASTAKLIEYERSDALANLARVPETNEDEARPIAAEKNRNGMRVNSIYSQDRWYAKEAPVFFTDVKEHGSFQRAYSLPARTQTPSSQNRVNLRRSVRGEPPPHPARLRKHRHGWTLHLGRPIESSGCTRSLVFLLILVLALLGIGAVALYIVFEPEKLHIIQQYLKSSTNDSSSDHAKTITLDERNVTSTTPPPLVNVSSLLANVLSSVDSTFPETGTRPATETETETETVDPLTRNSTRHCDDCLDGEVCVALADEEVPICRIGVDREDPTGCAGFCLINKQRCHRLDVDAFRCVEVEHYCLDDEWTCSNTLCIPLDKRCDGHMNCYDHSDEYDCVCDPETHFQCGNETSCLPLEKRCDGKIDCWDAADEINCTLGRNLGRSCPSEKEFTCSDGQCILKARFCDGLPDCLDRSDEPHGCQGRCNKHEFTCQNSRCVTKGMKCNGADDCGDGSDERHCKDRFS